MSDVVDPWSSKRPLYVGIAALILLVGGLGTWSVVTHISGAIIAEGLVEVEENRQVVQHPNGGVIGEILVDDGDIVEAGDVLMRFDDTLLRSDLAVINAQLFEIAARKARLTAERDDADTVEYPDLMIGRADDPLMSELLEGQRDLFAARKETLAREVALLNEKTLQIEEQIRGSEAQRDAISQQRALISEELADETELLAKGLSQATTVRALQREEASMQGSLGNLTASIAESRGRIAEIQIETLRLRAKLREDAITTLRDLQYRELELTEKQISLLETLQRLDIRASASGVIFGIQFHAIRSVVRPAEDILFIVPQNTVLVIATRIPAVHIDQVHFGQFANIKFSAFDAKTTPEIFGTITKISPDIFTDENTGESYYTAEILPNPEDIVKLKGLEIIPGMPVQAFLRTSERTPLQYLIKPLADYFNKAFRET